MVMRRGSPYGYQEAAGDGEGFGRYARCASVAGGEGPGGRVRCMYVILWRGPAICATAGGMAGTRPAMTRGKGYRSRHRLIPIVMGIGPATTMRRGPCSARFLILVTM